MNLPSCVRLGTLIWNQGILTGTRKCVFVNEWMGKLSVNTSELKDSLNGFVSFLSNRGELLSVGDIENIHKKRKHDKESRLETVLVSITIGLLLHKYDKKREKKTSPGFQREN